MAEPRFAEPAEARFCLTTDAVLVATGRTPNVEGLHLEAAGVELTERGAVKVDDLLRTTAADIWALGDVNGGPRTRTFRWMTIAWCGRSSMVPTVRTR